MCLAADTVRLPGSRRVTADDYEAFMTALCGMPPGPEREQCVRSLTSQLLQMYADYGGTAPDGLRELAAKIGAVAGRPELDPAVMKARSARVHDSPPRQPSGRS